MATIEVNGTRLYYVDTGPGSSGETIAFSHGLLWSTALFEAQLAALRGTYRCIAWDHRGQGQSDPDPTRENIGIELVWQDAVALLEALDPGPVHFCGLSMGGFVGMRMAARRPDLVRSLMLLETSSEREPVENLRKYRMMVTAVRLLGPWAVKSRLLPIMFGASILGDPARKAEVARYADLMSRRKDAWRACNGVIDRGDIHAELARITCPTLVVVGDEDVATVPEKAEKITSAIRGAKLVRIPRAGHSSPVEEPRAVTEALTTFLASLTR